MDNNSLTVLNISSLNPFVSLRNLSIKGNSLNKIEIQDKSRLRNLVHLDLSFNDLERLLLLNVTKLGQLTFPFVQVARESAEWRLALTFPIIFTQQNYKPQQIYLLRPLLTGNSGLVAQQTDHHPRQGFLWPGTTQDSASQ